MLLAIDCEKLLPLDVVMGPGGGGGGGSPLDRYPPADTWDGADEIRVARPGGDCGAVAEDPKLVVLLLVVLMMTSFSRVGPLSS